MKQPILFLLLSIITLIGFSCEKDCNDPMNPDCGNYDPCLGIAQPDADFGFYKKYFKNGEPLWLPIVDTVYNFNNSSGTRVYFRAHNKDRILIQKFDH